MKRNAPVKRVSLLGLIFVAMSLGGGAYFYLSEMWRPSLWTALEVLSSVFLLVVILASEFEKRRVTFWESFLAGLIMLGFLVGSVYYPLPLAAPVLFLSFWLSSRVAFFYGVLALLFVSSVTPDLLWVNLSMLLVTVAWSLRFNSLSGSTLYFLTLFLVDSFFRVLASEVRDPALFVPALIDTAITLGVFIFGIWVWAHIFNRTFFLNLLELLNPKNKLLIMLRQKAPGTYHHSLLVSTIASYAAERIEGADPLLTQVGGQYHDVGKIFHAKSFAENQKGKEIVNTSSTASHILAHVNAGLKMADRYKLPRAVKDIIATHHGDAVTSFYKIELRRQKGKSKKVKIEDFKYPGPRPWTIEQVLIMLADSTEAAVRSKGNKRFTREDLEEVVDEVISHKVQSHQLDASPLTGEQLSDVRKSFVEIFAAVHHVRVDWDEDETEN